MPLEEHLEIHSDRLRHCVGTSEILYILSTKAFDRTELVAISVTLEQESLASPIQLSFKTIQEVLMGMEIFPLVDTSGRLMVMWSDYVIGSYARSQNNLTFGLFLWNLRENSTFYFEVCYSLFPSLDALNPNSPTDGIRTVLSQSL